MIRVVLSGLSNPMAIYIQGHLIDFMCKIFTPVFMSKFGLDFFYCERLLLMCAMPVAEGHLFTPGGREGRRR